MKVVFAFLVALGAALYFPSSRAVLLDTVAPVLNPALGWATRGEMRAMARDLEQRVNTGRPIPGNRQEFETWLENNYQAGDSRTDSWGNLYSLERWTDSFAVVSPGPDGELGSGDDIRVIQLIERDRYP